MDTLWDKLEQVAGGSRIDAIMHIIENHIEWSDPKDCYYHHVYAGPYEITNEFDLCAYGDFLSSHSTLDEAKEAAQAHKEGRG